MTLQSDPKRWKSLGFRFLIAGTIALVHYTDNFAASGECDAWMWREVPRQQESF
jgi:hypothetical protein